MKLKLTTLQLAQTFAIAVIALGTLSAHAECAGCEAVKEVTAQVKKLKPNDPKEAWVGKAGKVIDAMPRGKDDVLQSDQIHEAVLLLAQIEKYDDDEDVIENILDQVLKPNLKAFRAEIKKLPPADQKLVNTVITMVLNEEKNGNDTP